MILKASQRGGGRELAAHLMKDENEHINVHEMRGFVANDLKGAFDEAHAISKATKCKQYLSYLHRHKGMSWFRRFKREKRRVKPSNCAKRFHYAQGLVLRR